MNIEKQEIVSELIESMEIASQEIRKERKEDSNFSNEFRSALVFRGAWEKTLTEKSDGVVIPLVFEEDPDSWDYFVYLGDLKKGGVPIATISEEWVLKYKNYEIVLKDFLEFDKIEK